MVAPAVLNGTTPSPAAYRVATLQALAAIYGPSVALDLIDAIRREGVLVGSEAELLVLIEPRAAASPRATAGDAF